MRLKQLNLQVRPTDASWSASYQWDRIERHMREAIGSLESLREYVLAKRDAKALDRDMTEGQFGVAYEHVYHHLNFAWNTRKMSEAAAEANFELHEKWPVEFDRYERKGDDDLPPVIPLDPRSVEFQPIDIDDLSENGIEHMRLPVLLGLSSDGTTKCADLSTLPHIIVAGATGQGKTAFLNTLIYRFITRLAPDAVRLIVCDPKHVEYTAMTDLPYLALPIVYESNQFVFAFKWTDKELERRLQLFARASCRNIHEYNERSGVDSKRERIPYLVMIVDEIADYMARDRKRIEPLISRICAKGRAAGVHLVIATQRPDRACITETIKANMPGRVAFKMAQPSDSRQIVGKNGAENLNGGGDMLFLCGSGLSIRRAQGAYIPDEKFGKACDTARARYGEPRYFAQLPKGKAEWSVFDK